MIQVETLAPGVLKVTPPAKLKVEDFQSAAPQIESAISERGQICLLVDGRNFHGWANMAAFEKHMGFIKANQKHVSRVAIIAGHAWQHWVAGVARIFFHPEIRVFDADKENEALQWVMEMKAAA